MIYPTKSGGDEWFLNSSGSNIDGETVRTGSDAEGTYYTISSNQVRAHALGKFGYKEGDINDDHGEIDANEGGTGHMQEGGGWRDIEMTGYYMGTQSGSESDMEYVPYMGGGYHTDGKECEGCAYKFATNYSNGEVRIRKEQWHVSYTSGDWRAGFGENIRNKWRGMKAIRVNRGAPPNMSVYMEIWIDKGNNNNWERVYTLTDDGGWGSGGSRCGGKRDQVLTWSYPIASFRWDIGGVRFKKFSVREIKEGNAFEPPPPGAGPTPPGPPGEDPWFRLTYPSDAIVASGTNGNVAANVNDQDLLTVWTHETLPAWIKIDMLDKKTVGFVKIAWTKGEQRTVGFNIELSEDNAGWNTAFSGNSTGRTAELEEYDFTDTNARFVRINVTSNSQKNTASIKEIEIWGDNTPIGATPPIGPEPPGMDPAFLYVSRKHVYHVNYDVGPECGPT